MSFNKKYLPDLPELIKVRETYSSDEKFLDIYFKKADAIVVAADYKSRGFENYIKNAGMMQ